MEKTIIEMKRRDGKIYITETVIFQGEVFNTLSLRVLHDDKNGYHVILPDQTIISTKYLKTLYKARKAIVENYNDAIVWCHNHNEKMYWY